jgi:hypothetical protein
VWREGIERQGRRLGYGLTVPFGLPEHPGGFQGRGRAELRARHLEALLDRMVRNAEIRSDLLGRLMLQPLPKTNLLALRQSRKWLAVVHRCRDKG